MLRNVANRICTYFIVFVLSFTVIGCTSMKAMNETNASLVENLEPGSHLLIYEKDGRTVDMQLTMIDGDTLHGALLNSDLTPVQVKLDDIAKIEVEALDGTETVLVVAAGTMGVVLGLLLITLATW